MTFSKKNHSTHSTPLHPLHSLHSTELFKIFFSLLTLSTAFLQKACGPGKNRLHNKWIKSRGTTTENVRKVEYKNYRSKLRNMIRVSEINYFKSKFTNACGDIKNLGQLLILSDVRRNLLNFQALLMSMVQL